MKKKDNKFRVVTLFLLVIFVGSSKNTYSQEEIININADLITVPVSVLDRNGRYLINLKKENFQVFENGVEQEIDFFESVSEPFTVFLLLDRSGSMSNRLEELADAASVFVNQLRLNDQVIAASFADDVDVLIKTVKLSDLKKGVKIRKYTDDRYTRLYDAVDYALEKMKKIQGRKALVVFSDGIGSGILSSFKENIRDAEEGKTLIYTVQFNTSPEIPPHYVNKKKFFEDIHKARTYMQQLAEVTGGRRYQIENLFSLEETFKTVAQELGQQYSLGYYPKETGRKGERRQIKVKVNVPDAAVRARSSYVVGDSKDK